MRKNKKVIKITQNLKPILCHKSINHKLWKQLISNLIPQISKYIRYYKTESDNCKLIIQLFILLFFNAKSHYIISYESKLLVSIGSLVKRHFLLASKRKSLAVSNLIPTSNTIYISNKNKYSNLHDLNSQQKQPWHWPRKRQNKKMKIVKLEAVQKVYDILNLVK